RCRPQWRPVLRAGVASPGGSPRAAGLDARALSEVGGDTFAADKLASGAIIGWFDGPMEFGPRALGGRSILADPRREEVRDIVNARIKHREPFRPFAPAMCEDDVGEYFEVARPIPWM